MIPKTFLGAVFGSSLVAEVTVFCRILALPVASKLLKPMKTGIQERPVTAEVASSSLVGPV